VASGHTLTAGYGRCKCRVDRKTWRAEASWISVKPKLRNVWASEQCLL